MAKSHRKPPIASRKASSGDSSAPIRVQTGTTPVKPWLSQVGTARRVGTGCAVVFHAERCAGCDGRCGVSVGGGEVPLDFEVPDGTPVEVVVSARDLARRALGVFGWPLGAVGGTALAAEWVGAGEALVVAALFGAALAVVAVRAARIVPEGFAAPRSRRAGTADGGVRVVLRG